MRLFYAPNTIAVAVAIALEEAGLDYESVLVDFTKSAQTKPDYHRINPKGRVPALEVSGHILTETGAILDYIGACVPETSLIPPDPIKAAQMRAVMYYVASTMHVNHAHKMRGHRWATKQSSFDDMASKVPENMAASADYIEQNCLAGPFILGNTLSIADPYLFAVCSWLANDGVNVQKFPKIVAFIELMERRASVVNIRAKGIQTA